MIKIGEYNTLKCIRESDLGYMLSDGKDEVLMHYKQSMKKLSENEEVKVFIYSDKEKRPTATMLPPLATISQAGLVSVIDVLPNVGVFVSINTPKDILVSKDYLPYDSELWPQIGDKLLIRLKLKGDILTAKPLNRYEIKELKSEHKYADFEHVDGYVCRILEKGIGVVTIHKVYAFIPDSQFRGKLRLGQLVNCCITKSIDGECYATLNPVKEELVDTDKQILLDYLKTHNGQMNFTAKSNAKEIESEFHMSRKAFKRAYGGLYKERLIYFDEEKTFLIKK